MSYLTGASAPQLLLELTCYVDHKLERFAKRSAVQAAWDEEEE
jgi:hypothetical protein